MSHATLLHTNGSKPHSPMDAWLQISTRKFFSSINWDDNPPEVQEVKQQAADNPPSAEVGPNLTVAQFFATVNWDDEAVVPAASSGDAFLSELLEESSSPFTLESFSDLF